MCSPSMFCVTTKSAMPCLASSDRARCVLVGLKKEKKGDWRKTSVRTAYYVSHFASSQEMLTEGFSPLFSRVQTPRGPRKS